MAAGRGEGDERPGWLSKKIQGILLDITGVLYNSGEGSGYAIQGSVEAVKKWVLKDHFTSLVDVSSKKLRMFNNSKS